MLHFQHGETVVSYCSTVFFLLLLYSVSNAQLYHLSREDRKIYLAQGALQFSQEVVITQVNCFVVDIINPKLQLLHYFKVVVNSELFGKLWVEAILNLLSAFHLLGNIGTRYNGP